LTDDFYARNSQILLQRVVAIEGSLNAELSSVLVVRSRFEHEDYDSRTGQVYGERVVIVDSQFENTSTSTTPVHGTELFVWNSTFRNLSAASAGGVCASHSAVAADVLEVALSTFFDNTCNVPPWCECQLEYAELPGATNSLFARVMPVVPPGEPPSFPPAGRYGSNCQSYMLDAFAESPEPGGRILAIQHPCLDGGDAEQLERSRQRLWELTEPFRDEFFRADLGVYAHPDWWRFQSVLTDSLIDRGAPDPGRHYFLAGDHDANAKPRIVPEP
jgi:hypothetical protein